MVGITYLCSEDVTRGLSYGIATLKVDSPLLVGYQIFITLP